MVNWLGVHLKLKIGSVVPAPVPLKVNEALESITVTQKDADQSGFQMVFQIGRGLADRRDFALMRDTTLRPFNRVVISVYFGLHPRPIMDGIITTHQLVPSDEPGQSKLTVTGEDVSLMMDLEKSSRAYPQAGSDAMVRQLLRPYLVRYNLLPRIQRPSDPLMSSTAERTRTKPRHMTDLAYIKHLAQMHGFVFYIDHGDTPLANTAYWGPPQRAEISQPALSVNMGPDTNVEKVSFKRTDLPPKRVSYYDSDDQEQTVSGFTRDRLSRDLAQARKLDFLSKGPSGESDASKRVRAQAAVNASFDEVVTAEGSLDALRYGRLLKPRSVVDLRGAGETYDGQFYVKGVTHSIDIRKGQFKQNFTLTREGTRSRTPVVRP